MKDASEREGRRSMKDASGPAAGRRDRRSPRPARGRGERHRQHAQAGPSAYARRVWISEVPGGVRG
jgi:hypothetical protein